MKKTISVVSCTMLLLIYCLFNPVKIVAADTIKLSKGKLKNQSISVAPNVKQQLSGIPHQYKVISPRIKGKELIKDGSIKRPIAISPKAKFQLGQSPHQFKVQSPHQFKIQNPKLSSDMPGVKKGTISILPNGYLKQVPEKKDFGFNNQQISISGELKQKKSTHEITLGPTEFKIINKAEIPNTFEIKFSREIIREKSTEKIPSILPERQIPTRP